MAVDLRGALSACVLLGLGTTGCQTRAEALDAICAAPTTCGAPCHTGDVWARLDAMRRHLDATIEEESAQRIYREYWANADRITLDTMSRAAMREERGTPDCEYFDWYKALPWPSQGYPVESGLENAPTD